MKKFVSMLLVSAMLVTALTACDNGKTNDSDSNPSTSTDSGNSSSTDGSSSSADSGISSGESSTDNESSTSEDSSSDQGLIEIGTSDSDDIIEPDNSGLPYPDNKAGNMAKAALATGSWPALDMVSDQDFLDALFIPDFKLDSAEEYCFCTSVISAQLYKVVVIKPKADKETEVSDAIDKYFDLIKNDPNIAFYPGQQASAEGAVKNKTDDGYYYIIVHEDGADIESAMLAAV